MKNRIRVLLVAGFCAVLAGCDNGRVSVTGKVTYRGQPVERGSISFEPIDGKGGTSGGSIEHGEFTLHGDTGVFPGKKRVKLLVIQKTGKQVPAGNPAPAGTMVEEVIPIYAPPQEADIVAGQENSLSFELP